MKAPLFIIILIGIATQACTERIDIQVDKSFTRLVVEGTISNDTMAHLVRIRKSADYFSGEALPNVEGAQVYIIRENDTTMLYENSAGFYYTPSDFFGVENSDYELIIRNVDVDEDGVSEEYRAFDHMPVSGIIDSIALQRSVREFGPPDTFINIQLYAQEPPEENYYIFKAGINGVIVTDTLQEWGFSSDEFYNGNYTNGIQVQNLDENDPADPVKDGDKITLELIQISSDYFAFLNAAFAESFGRIPLFSGPPANIPGNISNGGLGFFATVSVTRSSAVFRLPKEK